MFSNKRPNYAKLRTNLRLCINRLKLLQKKKTELALKARAEIAEYLKNAKDDRARIRVEHIVREDYLVEAMEIIEMYCDLLLARFGLIEKMKEMDAGLEEPICTLIWASPRLYSDVPELREVANQFTVKYGKEYVEACRLDKLHKANEKVIHKMVIIAPPKKLIENYLVEIAKTYNVPFEPDPTTLEEPMPVTDLLDIGFEGGDPKKPGGGGSGGGGGGMGGGMVPLSPEHMNPPPLAPGHYPYPGTYMPHPVGMVYPPMGSPNPPQYSEGQPPAPYQPPALPDRPPNAGNPEAGSLPTNPPGAGSQSEKPADILGPDFSSSVRPAPPPGGRLVYPLPPGGVEGHQMPPTHPSAVQPKPPQYDDVFGPGLHMPNPNTETNTPSQPPQPPGGGANAPSSDFPQLPNVPTNLGIPGLPSVPGDSIASIGGEDINFDDLTRRFEELKNKK